MTGQPDAPGFEPVSSDSKTDSRKRKPCSSLRPGPWLSGTAVCLSATSRREAADSRNPRSPDSSCLDVTKLKTATGRRELFQSQQEPC